MTELLLGVLLVLTLAWLVVRIRNNKAIAKTESSPKPDRMGVYHAVAIKYSENACDAAKALTGHRFLANKAPHLPLPECDFPDCRCQFANYDDRRSGNDRRSPFGSGRAPGSTGSYERERRERTDRRKKSDQRD